MSGPDTETRVWWKPKPKPRATPRRTTMVYFHCSAFQGTAMAFPGRAAACTFARMFVDGYPYGTGQEIRWTFARGEPARLRRQPDQRAAREVK